jgi:type III restriction enzyme
MSIDSFPLATAIGSTIDAQLPDIVQGQPTLLLEQVTPMTASLIRFWFQQDYCDTRDRNFHAGQRSAILAVIYAHEVIGAPTLEGLYREIAPGSLLNGEALAEVGRGENAHPKYAAKMATGTGKTWVLNALLVWQYLNHLASPDDERFTSNFLVVAPGLIVYDRLLDSFLGRLRDGERDFRTSDIFVNQEVFVPDDSREAVFGFVRSSVVVKHDIGRRVTGSGVIAVTNWHLLAGLEDPDFVSDESGSEIGSDAKAAIESFFPVTPGTSQGNALAVLDRRFNRGGPLEWLKGLTSLLVFNDEAHHIHSLKRGDQVDAVEWQKSLTAIAASKAHRFVQVDFSATPFNEFGRGSKKQTAYFKHIVVDFPLPMAMKAGLVKGLVLDKRKEVAALPLDFNAERDDAGHVVGLSSGQRTMIRAGLTKLQMLEDQFADIDPYNRPKLMIICEDTSVTGFVDDFLRAEGVAADDVLSVDSNRKGEMSATEWSTARERLSEMDRHGQPRIVVSVLMLREGFDVNNICVIVPLRASKAKILLEQTIGRGLRLMWRDNEQIDELKVEARRQIANKIEPSNYFDLLFIVEHPAFTEFYEDLMEDGLALEIETDDTASPVTGDLEVVALRDEYEQFDFHIPVLIRDADEELREPELDPFQLPRSKFPFEEAKRFLGSGDRFVSVDAETKTQFGDYRVNGGVMTATGYNDFLSRLTVRITEALGGKRSQLTDSRRKYETFAKYPVLIAFRPQLVGWIDIYIRERFFGRKIDPLVDENWRVLLTDMVTNELAGNIATALVQSLSEEVVTVADVRYRSLSEVPTISVRSKFSVDVVKSVYPKLPYPSHAGQLERKFMEWTNNDTQVEAFCKISEFKHTFLHRPYLKADGMPARYSPDFLVRTANDVYVVETKGESSLSDLNVQRKQLAAIAWCEQINRLEPAQRGYRRWSYVLAGEQSIAASIAGNERASELLARIRLRTQEEKVADEQIW